MSATAVQTASAELDQISAPPVVGEYKVCENCSFNFFRCISSSLHYCCDCFRQLTTVENQIWSCIHCGTERAWGQGRPNDNTAKDLRCKRCAKVTLHLYERLIRTSKRSKCR
jgi:hypothetical protein